MDTEQPTRQKRIYIATKMRGLTREQIENKLNMIAKATGNKFAEVINYLPEQYAEGKHPVELLGESIKNLACADEVVIEKYEETRGVSCEEYICNKYKIPYRKVFIEIPAE